MKTPRRYPAVSHRVRLILLLAGFAAGASLRAEPWTMRDGTSVEGTYSAVYGTRLLLITKAGSKMLDLDALSDRSVELLAERLDSPPPPTVRWADSKSAVAKAVAGKLEIMDGGKLVDFTPGNRLEPEFYLVYYGALWCGPCRKFSPSLVATYHKMKSFAPDRFEVIFVSSDNSQKEQQAYMREAGMPWPAVEYRNADSIGVFERWRPSGIPCLAVLTRGGELLYHSYDGDKYLGAMDPLQKFAELLIATAPGGRTADSAGAHRLAIARRVRSARGGDLPPVPYSVEVKIPPNSTIKLPEDLAATVQIDAQGRVGDVELTPEFNTIARQMVSRQVEGWLFLPAVVEGRAHSSSLKIPIARQAPQPVTAK